jgi:hypothetical protein
MKYADLLQLIFWYANMVVVQGGGFQAAHQDSFLSKGLALVFCNVPILGHYNFTECYAYQSSQIGVTESSGDIEGFYWARLASFIIRIHSCTTWFWFRCIPTISVILSYYGSYLN